MRPLAVLTFAALLPFACDKSDDGDGDDPKAPAKEAAGAEAGEGSSSAGGAPAVPRLKGAIELPAAIPADAAAVFAVRVPKSLFDSFTGADPLGIATEGMDDLEKDLDEFLGKTVGIQILDATAVTAFAMAPQDFAVVISGVSGEIKGTKFGAHAGVDLYGTDGGPLRLAKVDDALVLGTETATKAAIDASKDEAKSAKGSDLAKLVAAHTDGATLVIAADLGKIPDKLERDIPENFKIDRGLVVFGADGLTVRAEGDKAKLDALAQAITTGLKMATDVAEHERKRALEDPDDVVEGAAAIIGAHYMRSASKLLEPKVENDALTMHVPMKAGDPAVLAAFAGMGAAVAIPAFTKYTRRSKTSEARVQIAKMFDGASAYFNEEHVERGAVAVLGAGGELAAMAAHKCPNDGKTKGETGITPPLSVDCNAGPGGRCVPVEGGSGRPGYYDLRLWADNDAWNGLNFQQEQAHYFHYNFKWENTGTGFGQCQFTAQAFGDLDGDGIFSTFERSGAADENGVNAAAGLYIDNEVE